MTLYLIDNLLGVLPHEHRHQLLDISSSTLEKIRHAYLFLEPGAMQAVLTDIGDDVVDDVHFVRGVRNGSQTQWWASVIVSEFNLQPYLYRHGGPSGRYDLVIVSQPRVDDADALSKRLDGLKIV